jgi:hypothetical protein
MSDFWKELFQIKAQQMKKVKITSIIAFLFCSFGCTQKISDTQVPDPVKSSFANSFPGSNAEWKKVVTGQMQTARLIVIRAATSGGLLWELKEVVQVVNPKKLLITILNMRKKAYDSFIEDVEQIFNVTFPKGHELKRFGTISGFFRFSPSWNPNFLPLRAPFCRRFYKPYCALLKFTLAGV